MKNARKDQMGFSLAEMIVVTAIVIIVAGMAIPGYMSMVQYLRIAGDMRDLNGEVAQAKMQAAADFTHARAYADLANNTFHLETWNANGNGGLGCWQTVGDPANPCTAASSPVQPLGQGDWFGFGTLSSPPPSTQPIIAQAASCDDGTGGKGSKGRGGLKKINTACIVFNSRGIPIDNNLAPDGTGAFYVTNGAMVYGVTVTATGLIHAWSTSATGTATTWHVQ